EGGQQRVDHVAGDVLEEARDAQRAHLAGLVEADPAAHDAGRGRAPVFIPRVHGENLPRSIEGVDFAARPDTMERAMANHAHIQSYPSAITGGLVDGARWWWFTWNTACLAPSES